MLKQVRIAADESYRRIEKVTREEFDLRQQLEDALLLVKQLSKITEFGRFRRAAEGSEDGKI